MRDGFGAFEKAFVEAVIDGQRVSYDACGDDSLEEEMEAYKHMDYIGSGYIIYVNGTENEFKKLHHFFNHKKEV